MGFNLEMPELKLSEANLCKKEVPRLSWAFSTPAIGGSYPRNEFLLSPTLYATLD